MKWYHYTGIEQFKQILVDEALLAHYQKLIKICKGNPEAIQKAKERQKQLRIVDEREYKRLSNVFLTSLKDFPAGKQGNDVILGFELSQKPADKYRTLILPKVSLDNLVDIGAKTIHLPTVRETLEITHNGKYSDIPIYEI